MMRCTLLLLTPAVAACISSRAAERVHIYGTPFDAAPGPRAIVWPRGDGYLAVLDTNGASIRDASVAPPARLPPVGAVIVVLPPHADPDARRRARALAKSLGRDTSCHFVRARRSWNDVTAAASVHHRLAALHEQVRDPKKARHAAWVDGPRDSWSAVAITVQMLRAEGRARILRVVPLARGGAYAVRTPDGHSEKTADGVVAAFAAPPDPVPWPGLDLVPNAYIGVPHDAPPDIEEAAFDLALRLIDRAPDGGIVGLVTLRQPQAAMRTAADGFDALEGDLFLFPTDPAFVVLEQHLRRHDPDPLPPDPSTGSTGAR